MSNLQRLRESMVRENVPAILITDLLNIRWVSGFTGSTAIVLVTPNDACLITDSRYTLVAKQQVSELDVVIFARPQTLEECLAEHATKYGVSTIAFETSQSYAAHQKRSNALSQFEWIEAGEILTNLRKIKTHEEVNRIKAACQLADACMEHTVRLIQEGVKEFDINLDIEFFYRRHGAYLAFEPIVVSGPNSAKPHGKASDRALQRGDFVTVDCGALLDGYCSDITRTFVVGEASERHREIYEQVLRAEIECCDALRVGKNGRDVDAHARAVLAEKGLDQYFGHGLGHGLGMNVHDPGGLSPTVDQPLMAGMVFTVEPGVYIEDFGGVRIEDDVHITDIEPEILTHFPKELIIV